MKHLNKTTLISILLALFVMVSCKRHNAQLQAFADADGYNNADSLVSAIGDMRDFERLLVVTDSLERKGELTEVRAIFYKTIAYNIMGQHNTSLRLYYKLANFDIIAWPV